MKNKKLIKINTVIKKFNNFQIKKEQSFEKIKKIKINKIV